MTAAYRTIITPAQFAAELSLTGLFILGTDQASSIYNHATASSGSASGTITYSTGYATFASGAYINTGVVDPAGEEVTLAGVNRQALTDRAIVAAYTSNVAKTALVTIGFGQYKPAFIVCGTGANNAVAVSPDLGSQRVQGSDYFTIGSYTAGGTKQSRFLDPRQAGGEDTTAMDAGDARVSTGNNFMIGSFNSTGDYSNSVIISMVLIADYALSEDQEVRAFEWVSQYLHPRGIYP
jgi:hypothetical protein